MSGQRLPAKVESFAGSFVISESVPASNSGQSRVGSLLVAAVRATSSRIAGTTLPAGTTGSTLVYLRGLFVLLVLTTAAAFVYLGVFDISAHPLQSLYLVAYLGTLVLTVFILGWARARARATAPVR